MKTNYKKVKDSEITISQLMLPSHTNFGGKIHGGHLLMLMDEIAFACASKHSENYCVTASVDTVDFLLPIEVGELVTMKAVVNYVGHSSMVIGIRVDAENIRTGKKKHCNSSYFTMVAKDSENQNAKVPGLILITPKEIERFVRGLTRREMKKEYRKNFEMVDFSSPDLIKRLEDYRVKINLK